MSNITNPVVDSRKSAYFTSSSSRGEESRAIHSLCSQALKGMGGLCENIACPEEFLYKGIIGEKTGLGKTFQTLKKTESIYAHFVKTRVERAQSPSLIDRVSVHLERLWGATDSVSVVRNLVGLFAPAAVTIFGAIAILGGTLLSTSGAVLVLVKAEALALSILHKSREKIVLAFADLVAGFSAMLTGLFFIMEWAATFSKQILTAAVAGAALPIAAMCLYIVSLASSIYKVYVGSKFQSELNAALGSGDAEGLSKTLQWIRQNTQLSQKEIEEHEEKANGDDKNFAERVKTHLHNKWDEFALRARGEVFEFMKDALQAESLDDLIDRLDRGDLAAVAEAESWIQGVQEKNREGLKWSKVAIFSNIVGVIGMVTYLIFASYIASAVASAFFAVAAGIAIFADSSTVRAWTKKLLLWLGEKEKEESLSAVEACLNPAPSLDLANAALISAKRLAHLLDSLKEQDCSESEKHVEKEECKAPVLPTSSTTLDPSGASLPTPSPLMGETLPLSHAS